MRFFTHITEAHIASDILGRTDCPIQCGHNAAFVKLKTDKAEGKTAYPYIHCPGCGFQAHTRSTLQGDCLLKITRKQAIEEVPSMRPYMEPVPAPEPAPAAPVPKGYKIRLGVRVPL